MKKKNLAMRIASLLLVLTLVSLCAISGTLAKYTTSGVATDNARVAKWGVEVTVATPNTGGLEATYLKDTTINDITNTVVAKNASDIDFDGDGIVDNLLAPGTKGTIVTATVSGNPEVAVSVTYDLEFDLTGWTIDTGEYMPVVFTVVIDNTTKSFKLAAATNETNGEYIRIDDLKTAIEEHIEDLNSNYAANANLARTITISWNWAFEGPTTTDGQGNSDQLGYQTDIKDTKLGDLATAPEFAITLTTTVTQLD